jgi:hypothetical protein
MDLYIDGVSMGTGLGFTTAVASINNIEITTFPWSFASPRINNGQPLAYVDDLRIYTLTSPGDYTSAQAAIPHFITAIKPFWNITTSANTVGWIAISRDGGTTWNQSAIQYGVWYMFPTEAVGKDLCYKVRMSTTHVGDTPILYNLTLHYLYCNPPDVTLTGQSSGDKFGWSVSGAGDINGDTYDDIIIGAPYRNSGNGTIYIFNGSATLSGTVSAADADYIKNGTAGAHYGWSVSKAGDLDKDGKNDVMVGAPDRDNSTVTDSGWSQVLSLLVVVVPIPEFSAMLVAIFIPFGLSVLVIRKRRKAKTA